MTKTNAKPGDPSTPTPETPAAANDDTRHTPGALLVMGIEEAVKDVLPKGHKLHLETVSRLYQHARWFERQSVETFRRELRDAYSDRNATATRLVEVEKERDKLQNEATDAYKSIGKLVRQRTEWRDAYAELVQELVQTQAELRRVKAFKWVRFVDWFCGR